MIAASAAMMDLLLLDLAALLVLDGEYLAFGVADGGLDRRIGHGGARPIARSETLAVAALRLGEDHHADRLLSTVGLRRGADTDEHAGLDVRRGRTHDPEH